MPTFAQLALPRLVALLLMTTLGCVAVIGPAEARQDGRTHAEKIAAQKQLAELNSKMKALAREQADTAATRDSVNAELARQAEALAAAARAVRKTDAELASKQQQLDKLQQQESDQQKVLAGQKAAIADLLRATYALGHGSDLRLLMGEQDIGRIARALAYSKYFRQDRVQRVTQLMGDLAQLKLLEDSIAAEQEALKAAREKRQAQAARLGQQRAAQQKLAAQADARYKDQSQRLAAMKQNAHSLNHLLDQLQKAIDEAARKAAAEAAARQAAANHHHGGRRTPTRSPEVGNAAADIRGNLPWPASGAVNNYGNGVLIKARSGSDVHAVARGRVIYAAFLRGYGMLLILNHGNGWMSMYGNNETLLYKVGDKVEAGTVIGTAVAPTGIDTGVYFELRKNGKPVDPRHWLSQHR